jgi:hypothetical protein
MHHSTFLVKSVKEGLRNMLFYRLKELLQLEYIEL